MNFQVSYKNITIYSVLFNAPSPPPHSLHIHTVRLRTREEIVAVINLFHLSVKSSG